MRLFTLLRRLPSFQKERIRKLLLALVFIVLVFTLISKLDYFYYINSGLEYLKAKLGLFIWLIYFAFIYGFIRLYLRASYINLLLLNVTIIILLIII